MHCVEYRDVVAADVDGALTAEEALVAAAHVARCAACARLRERQRVARDAVRARALIQPAPAAARRKLLAAIEAVDEQESAALRLRDWWGRFRHRGVLAGAVAVLAVVVALPFLRSQRSAPGPEVFDTIVARYRALEVHTLPLAFSTNQPEQLREYYRHTGAFAFSNTVPNLEPFGYQLVGGAVVELAGRPSTLSVYRSALGLLLCHRILAADMPFPPGGENIGTHHVYSVHGITIAIHREGNVVCFLASNLPRDEFIRGLTRHA